MALVSQSFLLTFFILFFYIKKFIEKSNFQILSADVPGIVLYSSVNAEEINHAQYWLNKCESHPVLDCQCGCQSEPTINTKNRPCYTCNKCETIPDNDLNYDKPYNLF